MSSLIFYPGFEPKDENWLKFALIYLDKIRPIVPHSGDIDLSDGFRAIRDDSDLISVYRPQYDEAHDATLDAIEEVKRVLANPGQYHQAFGTPRIDRTWRNPAKYDVELYREKYTGDWFDYCRDENIGQQSEMGMLLSSELADVYMTILANCIADAQGTTVATDDASMATFVRFARQVPDQSYVQGHALVESNQGFDQVLEDAGIRSKRLALRFPNTNVYVERFIQTIQVECLDHFLVFGEKHFDYLVREFVEHYHTERPHQGLGNQLLASDALNAVGKIRCQQRLGGLLKHYTRNAA